MNYETSFIVVNNRPDGGVDYVCAPPGYTWTPDGIEQEKPCFRSPSPEWSNVRSRAHVFAKHRMAMCVRNLCGERAKVFDISA